MKTRNAHLIVCSSIILSFSSFSAFGQNSVDEVLAQRLKDQDLIKKIYADKNNGQALPPDNEKPDVTLNGRFISQGMQFQLPDEIPMRPKVIFQTALENCNDRESKQFSSITATSTDSHSWTNTQTWGVGVEAKFKVKVPFIGETETTVKGEYSSSNSDTTSEEKSVGWNTGYEVLVGPEKKVTVQFVVSEEEYDVPYSVDFVANGNTDLTISEPGSGGATLNWVNASNGYVPPNAVIAGTEPGRTLYVCRADYNGGTHPGKVVANNCNFGWGGKEIRRPNYQVLVKESGTIQWRSASAGGRPASAYKAGWEPARGTEPARDLYLCRAGYQNGVHPGKIVKHWCHFGWGGKEILRKNYEVMVTQQASPSKVKDLQFNIEDYLSLQDRTFTVRGTYKGVRGVQGHVRVGPPQPLETCGQFLAKGARGARGPREATPRKFISRGFSQRELTDVEPLTIEYTIKTVERPTSVSAITEVGLTRLQYLLRPFIRGSDVESTQHRLKSEGLSLRVDGIFGPQTASAVRQYQESNGLKVDGIVGPQTRSSLGL